MMDFILNRQCGSDWFLNFFEIKNVSGGRRKRRKKSNLTPIQEEGSNEDCTSDTGGTGSTSESVRSLSIVDVPLPLEFPFMHAIGGGLCLLTWSGCMILMKSQLLLTPWIIPAILSSGIACKGLADTLSELTHLTPNENRILTLSTLMWACGALIPVPFISMAPGITLPVRIAIPGVVGACAIFEAWYPEILAINQSYAARTLSAANSESHVEWSTLPAGALKFVQRYFENTDGKGMVFAAACIAATSFALGLDFIANQWRGLFFDAIQKKQGARFTSLLKDFLCIGIASILAGSYSSYMTGMWDLHWRQFMTTDLLSTWFRGKAFFKLNTDKIDNCDQRISDDVRHFVAGTRGIGVGTLESLGRLSIFLPQLMISAPSIWIWAICLSVSIFSSIITHTIGQGLIPNHVAIQASEANFRSSLIRVREEAEPIALMGSEDSESASCQLKFEQLLASIWSAMQVSFRLNAFTSGYGLCSSIFPFLILSPYYFNGSISMGTMFLLEGVMGNVQQALSFFIMSYGELAHWRATTDRLMHLENSALGIITPTLPVASNELSAKIPLLVAGDRVLLENASIDIKVGDRILITGAEGKSTLMKTLALVHPCDSIEWTARPESQSIMFVPQKSLSPSVAMTLRELLEFPDNLELIDPEVALETVGLGSWIKNLDEESKWNSTLSTNEAQRITAARLLCKPLIRNWIFLDDPVSYMTSEEIKKVYTAFSKKLESRHTVITISRSATALKSFHQRHMVIDSKQLLEIEQSSVSAKIRKFSN